MSEPSNDGLTLVCGGGGVWGVAWMTGLARGLADHGVDLREADSFIGTSAGSVISTQLASGLDLESLFLRQTEPGLQPPEPAPDVAAMPRLMELMQQPWKDAMDRRRAMCELALEAPTISAAERRANIVARLGLPDEAWPLKWLSITAIDTETQELVVFDRDSGISVYDAVAASCSVPGVWPPAPINGRAYVDGGISGSSDNASLASGAERILIISPMGSLNGSPIGEGASLADEVARLEASGAKVAVIAPDETSLQSLALGPLDPASRSPAARAGRNQASAVLSLIEPVWTAPEVQP